MSSPNDPPDIGRPPYRDARPSTAIIPPDRRRQIAATLVITGIVVGATAYAFTDQLRLLMHDADSKPPAARPAPVDAVPPPPDVTLAPVTLHGPEGTVHLPQKTAVVVHAWVQDRPDSMAAFRALRDLRAAGGLHLPVPIINVAYRQADPDWAATWGVRDNLVVDPDGAAIFKPLGVDSMTTYVIDASGKVRYTDRPDRAGYAQRLERVVVELGR